MINILRRIVRRMVGRINIFVEGREERLIIFSQKKSAFFSKKRGGEVGDCISRISRQKVLELTIKI